MMLKGSCEINDMLLKLKVKKSEVIGFYKIIKCLSFMELDSLSEKKCQTIIKNYPEN